MGEWRLGETRKSSSQVQLQLAMNIDSAVQQDLFETIEKFLTSPCPPLSGATTTHFFAVGYDLAPFPSSVAQGSGLRWLGFDVDPSLGMRGCKKIDTGW